ncbi:MAG TPA: hypothetical protein VMR77_03650 [Patescibacteria group bacterium]|nr:hypothetical protein [Patescibacteria group bacterium]
MEEKIKIANPTLHRYLFTVTAFSKLLALSLFIILPFLGFYLGMQYQQKVTVATPVVSEVQKPPTPTPTPSSTIGSTTNWKTYTNTTPVFSFTYPSNYAVDNRSKQFPPSTLFVEDMSKQVGYEGGGNINPYFTISINPSTVSITDYVNNKNNNLTYLSTQSVSANTFIVTTETHGAGCGSGNQYLLKSGDFIISLANNAKCYGISDGIFNQILSTLKF